MKNEDFDRIWSEVEWQALNPTQPGFNTALRHRFARAIIAQARAEMIAELHAYADRQYCIGVEKMRRPECMGWEYKAKNGKFGETEFKAHAEANKAFGAHFGIYAATKENHE